MLGAVLLVAATGSLLFFLNSRQLKSRESKAPSARQVEALSLKYPPAGAVLPESITFNYDKARNRSRMTLVFSALPPTGAAAAQYAPSAVEFRLISEFTGTERRPDKGESSLDGRIVAHTRAQGLLAVAEPPGLIIAGAATIEARPASKSKSGYKSEIDPAGGFRESLVFKIDTSALLTIAAEDSASAKFGALSFVLTPAQMADLREFAARLNPNP